MLLTQTKIILAVPLANIKHFTFRNEYGMI